MKAPAAVKFCAFAVNTIDAGVTPPSCAFVNILDVPPSTTVLALLPAAPSTPSFALLIACVLLKLKLVPFKVLPVIAYVNTTFDTVFDIAEWSPTTAKFVSSVIVPIVNVEVGACVTVTVQVPAWSSSLS